ncbi:MAG: imidazole glycerol phosphate synthase subunit HisF [Gemmatimonadaceae bacterium]
MTLRKRVIVCLDVSDGRVVKGVQFAGLRDVGDPATLAAEYEAAGADEIVFLDISATVDGRETLLDCVRRTAENLFIPLTVGGGIRSVGDASRTLRAGADKIAVNSAAVARPELLTELSARFGAQCVVASIDAKRVGTAWEVFVRGGSTPTGRDAAAWARECSDRGAGEILLTSIDRDGTRTGYDLVLTRAVRDVVPIPVIASGGAGSAAHVCDAFTKACADAALLAGIVHDGDITVGTIKRALSARTILIRDAA